MFTRFFQSSDYRVLAAVVCSGLLAACATRTGPGTRHDLTAEHSPEIEPLAPSRAEAMAWYAVGLNREIAGDFDTALEAFLTALAADPESEDLHTRVTEHLIRTERLDQAFGLLKERVEQDPNNHAARRWLARLALHESRFDLAASQYDELLKANPSSEGVYLEAIAVAAQQEDGEKILDITEQAWEHADEPRQTARIRVRLLAQQEQQAPDVQTLLDQRNQLDDLLDTASKRFPEDDFFLFARAERDIRGERLDLAFTRYQQLHDREEDPEELRNRILFHALAQLGGDSNAVRVLQRHLEDAEEENTLTVYLLGMIAELRQHTPAARRAYEQVLEMDPADRPALRRSALLDVQDERPARAFQRTEKLLDLNPDDAGAQLLAGQLALQLEDFPQAATHLRSFLQGAGAEEAVDSASHIHAQLAMSLLMIDASPSEIQKHLLQAAETGGRLTWIWRHHFRQVFLTRDHDRETASKLEQRILDQLLDLSDQLPENLEVEQLIGQTLRFREEYTAAISSFERVLHLSGAADDLSRADETLLFDLAATYERSGRFEDAERVFQALIDVNPDHHAALNYLAYMWAEKGLHLEQAYAYVTRAIELDPDNGAYIDTLGWVYFQQGRFEEAYRELLRAAELEPDESVILEHLGDVMMELGRPQEAVAYYRIALELDARERESLVRASLEKAQAAYSESIAN